MKEPAAETGVVHVVDDNEGIRRLVVINLETVGLKCVAWADPAQLLRDAPIVDVDVFVVDIRLAGMSGLELVRQLRSRGSAAPVIFISGVNEVAVTIEAMKLGAHDFLPKPFSGQALIDAVQAALVVRRAAQAQETQVAHARKVLATLSPREKQVLLGVVDGQANKVIAMDLGLSEKTVEEHRKHMMTKLGETSVAGLVKLAVLGGICNPAAGSKLS